MINLPVKLMFCFAGVCALAYSFDMPRRLIFGAGIIGIIGFGLYNTLAAGGMPDIMCFFLSTLSISLLSEAGAIWGKTPAAVFLSTSIIVLVPGLGLYRTVSFFVSGNYAVGAETGIRTFLAVGAMAIAVAAGTLAVRAIKRLYLYKRRG